MYIVHILDGGPLPQPGRSLPQLGGALPQPGEELRNWGLESIMGWCTPYQQNYKQTQNITFQHTLCAGGKNVSGRHPPTKGLG